MNIQVGRGSKPLDQRDRAGHILLASLVTRGHEITINYQQTDATPYVPLRHSAYCHRRQDPLLTPHSSFLLLLSYRGPLS
jgi:hypothetical protein